MQQIRNTVTFLLDLFTVAAKGYCQIDEFNVEAVHGRPCAGRRCRGRGGCRGRRRAARALRRWRRSRRRW